MSKEDLHNELPEQDRAMADDTLQGAAAIAKYLRKTPRQVFYLCETRQIPAFKLGGKWHLRKSSYARHVERLEARAIESAA